jgi:hypothetical protein
MMTATTEAKANSNGRQRTFAMKGLPFKNYAELQRAYADKKIGIGVDPLAAAEWSAAVLLALPIQALAFYGAHLDAPFRMWVTLAGVASLIIFIDFLFNQMPTAATLVAYAGLTFAAVRASSSITHSAFRKALTTNEELFLDAFANKACTIRDSKTKQVYGHKI